MAAAVITRGYKPHVAAALLDIGPQTLRYWRKHVDPRPHRAYFSGGVLFAYRTIKLLTRRRHVPVEILERCKWDSFFCICESNLPANLAQQRLSVNERTFEVTLVDPDQALDYEDLDQHFLPLAPVIIEHTTALLNFGCPH